MNNRIIVGVVIGLVVGLALGVFIGIAVYPSVHSATGTHNQVQVSGTVTHPYGVTSNTLYFQNLNGSFETSASIVNGRYSVLLIGGQSYNMYDYSASYGGASDYQPFYVPLGVSTFTENLVPSS
jgi:hypothetical protein